MLMDKQTVLVTEASGGIGLATTIGVAQQHGLNTR
jgi:NAD(P)-dependent dehydrogenase (short-subunit alcohol dehydrogenase family)